MERVLRRLCNDRGGSYRYLAKESSSVSPQKFRGINKTNNCDMRIKKQYVQKTANSATRVLNSGKPWRRRRTSHRMNPLKVCSYTTFVNNTQNRNGRPKTQRHIYRRDSEDVSCRADQGRQSNALVLTWRPDVPPASVSLSMTSSAL